MNNSFKLKISEVILLLLIFSFINTFFSPFFAFLDEKYQKFSPYLYPIHYLLPYLILFYIIIYFWIYYKKQSLNFQFYKIRLQYIFLYITLFCLSVYTTNLFINILSNNNSKIINYLIFFLKKNYNISIKYYLESMQDTLKKIFNYLYTYPISGCITIGILAPIVEEVLFRGIILQGLINYGYKKWYALIFASFIFAILHINFLQIISAFILGMIIGWIYLDSKSLIFSIILHIINNLGICCFYLFFKFNNIYIQNSILVNLILLIFSSLSSIFIMFLIKNNKIYTE